ncbi:hypothetical protein DRE_07549 [Drechslerella stenobrocha 248]|uniref:GH16 domain-containing protein n=1 Tax=Drechslerella stenobrocha 248 TaxID=1043628 RepID=W7I434_9PEZI|nr:hypothetical protein DRE_07549 [Drechslerella stenobrocha 248]
MERKHAPIGGYRYSFNGIDTPADKLEERPASFLDGLGSSTQPDPFHSDFGLGDFTLSLAQPAPARPAPVPVQPPAVPQSTWAKKALLMKKRASSHKTDSVVSYPHIPPKAHHSPYRPAVPSPLNPASSGSEGEGSASRSVHSSDGEHVDATQVSITSSSSSAADPPVRSNTIYSTDPIIPKASLMDLGREYDRYPARTPRNSVGSIYKTPSSTPPKRHSNPLLLEAPDQEVVIDASDSEKQLDLYPTGESFTKPMLANAEFPLYIDEAEADDYLHNPGEFDEKRSNHSLRGIGWRGLLSFFSFWLFVAGLLALFVILPVLTFTGYVNTPDDSDGESHNEPIVVQPWEYVSTTYRFPILGAIRTNMVDPTTPEYAKTRKATDGSTMKLVFSDEFNTDGRTFYEGDDQFWTAADLHYAATQDLEWYDPDAATTAAGTLRLKLDAWKNHDLNYRSGMLQSWNKLCFKGGVLEVSASLPAPGGKLGLWPGIWTLGNLARPGYLATSDGTWPYSYDECDIGITPNQSSPDGISFLPGQRLNSCTCKGEDHPNAGAGRGAPEIDALEASGAGALSLGVASQSTQIAPYDVFYVPDYDFVQIHNHSVTEMNTWCGGPFQQAISGVTSLNNKWYGGKEFQKYAFEYEPGKGTGHITWFVGDEPTFTVKGEATGPNGNVGTRHISQEPMSIILNLGVSNSWVYIDWPALEFPATMYIDYVRIYQPEGSEGITCDPPGYPTTGYINKHMNAYTNPNLTSWSSAGYEFPKNTLMNGCSK